MLLQTFSSYCVWYFHYICNKEAFQNSPISCVLTRKMLFTCTGIMWFKWFATMLCVNTCVSMHCYLSLKLVFILVKHKLGSPEAAQCLICLSRHTLPTCRNLSPPLEPWISKHKRAYSMAPQWKIWLGLGHLGTAWGQLKVWNYLF